MSGDFPQSADKYSILSRNTLACVSPFASFENRLFERGGLKRKENEVGGSGEKFLCMGVTLRRGVPSSATPATPATSSRAEAPGYPAEAESAATGSRRGHFAVDKNLHSIFPHSPPLREPLRCGVLELSQFAGKYMASFGCHSPAPVVPATLGGWDSVFVWPNPPHHHRQDNPLQHLQHLQHLQLTPPLYPPKKQSQWQTPSPTPSVPGPPVQLSLSPTRTSPSPTQTSTISPPPSSVLSPISALPPTLPSQSPSPTISSSSSPSSPQPPSAQSLPPSIPTTNRPSSNSTSMTSRARL